MANDTNSITPTLSTLRVRLYELDANRTQGWWQDQPPHSSVVGSGIMAQPDKSKNSFNVALAPRREDMEYLSAMPDAIHLIREQHRLLMEAKEVVDECHDQLWHLAKKPESSVLVQKAKAFLRQLEESV